MSSPRVREILESRIHGVPPPAPASPRSVVCSILPDGAWRGRRCFIIGGGPSLKGFDFGRLRGDKVIAINKAFFDAPFADIMFSIDRGFLDLMLSGQLGADYLRAFESFDGVKLWLDIFPSPYPSGIYSVPAAGKIGWSKSLAGGLFHGQNSGYGALNLALVLGADPVYLLGYDLSMGPKGETNYHAGYPSGAKQEDLDTFRSDFEAGARLLDGKARIINLNPNSALKCFEFGDIDKVLPRAIGPAGQRITAITPTGDRLLAFRLCREWMANQTRRPDHWIVVDDGKDQVLMRPSEIEHFQRITGFQYVRREPRPDDPKHTLDLNMKAAIPLITGDKILIIEDDEYYAPGYIEEMARHLDEHEVVGICRSKYYHVPTGGYQQISNVGHSSLAQTGFRRSFLPIFESFAQKGIVSDWLDTQIWKHIDAKAGTPEKIQSLLFVDKEIPLYVGMKGLPGRPGMGAGHGTTMYKTLDAVDRAQLRAWVPRDYQVYLDIIGGTLTEKNADAYFKEKSQAAIAAALSPFDSLIKSLERDSKRLNQHVPEWREFLELVSGYFKARGISRPVVVEVGVLDGAQKRFYEGLLGAEYIGIDIDPKSPADIVGDSGAPETVARLKAHLGGRPIDLLFVDGLHTYAGVKADYELYGPLTRHIIAFHDIHTPKLGAWDAVDVCRFWSETLAGNKTETIVTIQRHNPRDPQEFNGRAMGIGILIKDANFLPAPQIGQKERATLSGPSFTPDPKKTPGADKRPCGGQEFKQRFPTISVISRWWNEEFFAPFFLSHYSFADEIIIMLDKGTTDRSAEIIGRYPNARFEYSDHGGKINDRLLAEMMSDLAASLKSNWIIYVDADELAFPFGAADPREVLGRADGNLVEVWFRWVYRHSTETDLDPLKPAIWQRRHGGVYMIVKGGSDKFMKPCIVKPETKIRWGAGQHGYEPNPAIKVSSTKFDGVHWQMADVEVAVKRFAAADKRLSAENLKQGWGVRNFTEAQIRAECKAHENDPLVI